MIKLTPRRAAAGKYHAPLPPTTVHQRAAAAAPKHPVRRRRVEARYSSVFTFKW